MKIADLSVLLATIFFISCGSSPVQPKMEERVFVPKAVDYSDNDMWETQMNDADGTGADLFYVVSTWEYDWTTADGALCHYADPSRADHRADMKIEIEGVAEYMAPGNNFYAPYYRHISLDSWATLNEDTINRRYRDVAFVDIRNAFSKFMERRDPSRPFILAGFSQGGKSVVELLKILDPETREKLVAAYVLGYKVTPDDVAAYPYIVGAEGAADTGVVICYNSVSDPQYVKPVVAAPNVMSINPVNWRTDDEPAILDDTITVTLDPASKALVVKGYDGSHLPNILGILNVGDYHGAEPWLYSDCLRDNIRRRIEAFRSKK